MIRLIVADENESYIKALAQYIQLEHGQAFEVTCFTQAAVLQQHLMNCGRADILLINHKLLEEVNAENIKTVILLVDAIVASDMISIYKFQKADQITRLLLEAYDRTSGGSANILKSSKESKLICVYSPAGAAGKSTLAYNLAQQYAMQGQKILFLSFEAFSALSLLRINEPARGLLFLLHLIKNKQPNLQLKLNAIKGVDGNTNIHFIERESNVLEYKDIRLEDMELLIGFLKKHSGYDVIILDLDSTMNEIALGAFKCCDAIVTIHCDNSAADAKQEAFIGQIPKINDFLEINISRKIFKVLNKYKAIGDVKDAKADYGYGQLQIPYINNLEINQGTYYPEMEHFKQLYDMLEDFLLTKVIADEGGK